METPSAALHPTDLKRLIFRGRSLLAEKSPVSYTTEIELPDNKLVNKGRVHDLDYTIRPKVHITKHNTAEKEVNLIRPPETTASYLEICRFLLWSIVLVLTQAWRDLMEGRPFKAILATDAWTHYYYIPMSRRDPRIIIAGAYNRIMTRIIPPHVTRRYEEAYDYSQVEPLNLINCASNNYAGFTELEYGSGRIIESALHQLPFAPAPADLEKQVRLECAAYMDFEACVTAPSGFSTNILAFATVAAVASNLGKRLVFFCDRDCHNSMFTGAFYNKEAKVHKFNHNDLIDLEYKLRKYREQDPSAFVCVAVEGIYSLEGAVSPGPALVALKKAYKFALLVDEAHSFMALGSAGRGSFNYWEDAGYECPLNQVDIMSCMFSKAVGCTGGFVLANGISATELRKQGEARDARGVETLATIVLLRILNLLRKPLLIRQRMKLLRKKATYVANALCSAGFPVISIPGSAVICFIVGTVSQVSIFHGEAVKVSIAIAGAGPPATDVWACRIQGLIRVARKLRVRNVRPVSFDPALLDWYDPFDPAVKIQCDAVDEELLHYVDKLSSSQPLVNGQLDHTHELVRKAGVEALREYAIGPCSARWFYGHFDIFVQLERRLASLYPSLLDQSGYCRGEYLLTRTTMICGDIEVTIGSTLTALMMRCASKKIVNRVFVPNNAPRSVMTGAKLNRPSQHVTLTLYEDLEDLLEKIDDFSGYRFHTTLYLQTLADGVMLDLIKLLREITPRLKRSGKLTSITIMLDDRNGLGKIGPQSLGYLNLMEANHGIGFLRKSLLPLDCSAQVLVAGSWFDAFGHQGGYVTGTADTVEQLTWDAKAFFFSTPPMPVQAAMSDRMLELLSQRQCDAKK
ncbi:pyridoxal phosphate-dependent transferase [Xylogone sp. PMI_703]|nr:pyridoxal phosphate-dependent transferase [Xylogone sp. PMI_703]